METFIFTVSLLIISGGHWLIGYLREGFESEPTIRAPEWIRFLFASRNSSESTWVLSLVVQLMSLLAAASGVGAILLTGSIVLARELVVFELKGFVIVGCILVGWIILRRMQSQSRRRS